MAINSKSIFFAKVFHKRLSPKINEFLYEVFYICFDISKISALKCYFLSLNKFNIFSFYEKDHGNKDGSSIQDWAKKIFANSKAKNKIKKIFLFTHPRVLGYAFNPVSFWFGIGEDEKIYAIIAQVNNTFGENHIYLIDNENLEPIHENQWFDAKKEFHVSPFYSTEGQYKFRFIFNQNKIAVWIDYYIDNKTLLTNVISSKQLNLNNINLLKTFLLMPLMTFKVIYLIHFQALKLFIKKLKYIPKPPQKNIRITTNLK